jgi:hypothetical protein
MNEKIDSEKLPAEPNVLCPTEFASPFLSAANAIDSQYDELRKILLKIEELISERKIKELRLAGEELLRIVNARPSSQNEGCWNRESHFSFKTNTRNYQAYEQSRREPTTHTVPFVGDVTGEDVALFSALTRKSKKSVPLRIAQALVDPQFNWRFCLSQIREIIKPIPLIPEIAVQIPGIYVDDKKRLVARNPHGDSAIEVGLIWRVRGQLICNAVRESSEDDSWSKKSVQTDLVRIEDKYIWLSLEAPSKSALLCPGLIQLKDHFEEVSECLKLWRTKLGTSGDSSARIKRWLESKPNAAPWIAQIAEMILTNFSPWPDPYTLRPENDSSFDLSPEQCLKQVLPLFRALAKAPLRDTPPNLVKTFLYLIRRPNVDAVAYTGQFSEMWNFSVRTYDHSWINGEIIGEPHATLGSSSPLKFREIGGNYGGDSEGFCISCNGIDCFISEEKNKRF